MISTVGAGGSSWLVKLMLQMFNGRAGFADYERADARIRSETNVPFAVIRPYALNNKPPTGRYTVIGGRTAHIAKPIPQPDVAKFFLDCVEDTRWDGPGGVNIGGA
ncbi:MAG: NAD(P)H-binding protein [Paraburkholderia fungorum]|nr:NAD(P)H-binding protein [Paraburkholderia fungorum]